MVEENPSHKGEANSQHGGKKGTQSVNTQALIPKTTTAKGLSANPTGKQTADKKEEPLKKIEKQGLIIAWAGFIVACTTGVVFFCQFREMQKQTKAIQQQTRQDQRAWLRFIIGNPQWTFENQTGAATVSFPVTFANTGKTPATFIAVAVAVDIVQNGRQPNLSLEEGIPKTTTIRKILWQGEQDAIEVPLSSPIVGDLGHTQLRILSKPEYQSLVDGKTFLVVYGFIDYADVFGIHHWTKTCGFGSESPKSINVTSQKCVDYNDVDHQQ